MNATSETPLLPPSFLFRMAVSCRKLTRGKSQKLGKAYELPTFAQLDERKCFAEVRLGWSPDGLRLAARIKGKSQPPWCRRNRAEDSDGLQVWICTRDPHGIHRATRFCHRLAFLPQDGPSDQPVAQPVEIGRARERPVPPPAGSLEVAGRVDTGGYGIEAWIASEALTGYDPAEHPTLGFTYAVFDRELGCQPWLTGPEHPVFDDPSLWGLLQLQ